MSLKDTIHAQMIQAMRDGEKTRLATLRLVLSAFTEAETSGKARSALTPDDEIKVVRSVIGKTRKSISEFEKVNSPETAERIAHAQAEIALLEEFVPTQLDEDATRVLVQNAVAGAGENPNLGAVMGALKKTGANLDMGLASKLVREALA